MKGDLLWGQGLGENKGAPGAEPPGTPPCLSPVGFPSTRTFFFLLFLTVPQEQRPSTFKAQRAAQALQPPLPFIFFKFYIFLTCITW